MMAEWCGSGTSLKNEEHNNENIESRIPLDAPPPPLKYLPDTNKARGCSTNTVVPESLTDSSFVNIIFLVPLSPNDKEW